MYINTLNIVFLQHPPPFRIRPDVFPACTLIYYMYFAFIPLNHPTSRRPGDSIKVWSQKSSTAMQESQCCFLMYHALIPRTKLVGKELDNWP